MTSDEIRNLFRAITVWRRGDERAPHKPLLALYAIARLLRSRERMIPYAEVDRELGKLLIEFGPRRQSYHPEYPFWRLQNDGLWEVSPTEGLATRSSNTDVKKSELIEHNVHGGFLPEIYNKLSEDKHLVREIVQDLLDANFPESIHQDILDEVGIEFEIGTRVVIARSPDFRERILRAYEYSCAVCGFDVRLGTVPVALEAAHIKWHQAGGPDEERNGLALCTLHHKLLTAACSLYQTLCRSSSPRPPTAPADFKSGSLYIMAKGLECHSGPPITPMKTGLPGMCAKSSRDRSVTEANSAHRERKVFLSRSGEANFCLPSFRSDAQGIQRRGVSSRILKNRRRRSESHGAHRISPNRSETPARPRIDRLVQVLLRRQPTPRALICG